MSYRPMNLMLSVRTEPYGYNLHATVLSLISPTGEVIRAETFDVGYSEEAIEAKTCQVRNAVIATLLNLATKQGVSDVQFCSHFYHQYLAARNF